MLAKLQVVLQQAQRKKYAVGAFNVSNLEQVQAVIFAAVAQRSPVIINTSEKAITYTGLAEIASLVRTMADKYPVPIVLNLDHGRQVKLAKACLTAGYSGIMFDGSRLSYQKNIQDTIEVVRAGKKRGIGVEGEVGLIKYQEDWQASKEVIMTDPDQAADFVRQTGVCAFAVAIGNAHGLHRPGERLHFDRLQAISRRVKVPLVLHGASDTSPANIRRAISLGICKINIDTSLRLAFNQALRATLRRNPQEFDPRAELGPARDAVMVVVAQKMKLFGSKGQAR